MWPLLESILFAFLDESVDLFKQANTSEQAASDYLEWLRDGTDNHRFIASMVFDYLFGIMLFRISVRRNCFEGLIS